MAENDPTKAKSMTVKQGKTKSGVRRHILWRNQLGYHKLFPRERRSGSSWVRRLGHHGRPGSILTDRHGEEQLAQDHIYAKSSKIFVKH